MLLQTIVKLVCSNGNTLIYIMLVFREQSPTPRYTIPVSVYLNSGEQMAP